MSKGKRIVPHSQEELANLHKGQRLQSRAARVRIESMEELLDFGAPTKDIPARAGWAHRASMRKALDRADRKDLWVRFLERNKQENTAPIIGDMNIQRATRVVHDFNN